MKRSERIGRNGCAPSAPRSGCRLRLEALEDRSVPATLTVTSSADDLQPHTLRYAVAHAQSGDTILLTGAVKGPIVLTRGELELTQNVTIRTAGNRQATISGNGQSRIFEVASGASVKIANLKITDGNGVAVPGSSDPSDGFGGGILVDAGGALTITDCTIANDAVAGGAGGGIASYGTLTVDDSRFTGNSAVFGGGIYIFSGTATVTDSTFTDGFANIGGAICNNFQGTLTVSDCTFADNVTASGGAGGAIASYNVLAVVDSTFVGNSAVFGGGIYIYGGTASVTDSTFVGNVANIGGAIENDARGTMTVTDCTFSYNATVPGGAGGAIANYNIASVTGSTFVGNSAGIGGAIWNGGTLALSGSTLSRNTATMLGGGIANSGLLYVFNSVFSGNSPDDINGSYIDQGGNIFYSKRVSKTRFRW